MPLPIPVFPTTDQPIIQITEAHSVGDAGWSESYYIRVVGAGNPLQAAVNRHAAIIGFRRPEIPVLHIIESVRASDVVVSGDSILLFPPNAELGAGPVLGPAANPALGYFATIVDSTFTVNETRIYRGWGQEDMAWKPDSPRTTVPAAKPLAFLTNIQTELAATRTLAGMTTNYMIKSFVRPGGAVNVGLVEGLAVDVDANNQLRFESTAAWPVSWVPGKRIHVNAPRVKCVRGVSGIHLLTSVSSTPPFLATTSTVYDCAPTTLSLVTAKAFIHMDAWYPLFGVSIGGAGKRDTGRPFYLTRGRSRIRP